MSSGFSREYHQLSSHLCSIELHWPAPLHESHQLAQLSSVPRAVSVAALWFLVTVWYWTKCWHLAEAVTVTVMTAALRPFSDRAVLLLANHPCSHQLSFLSACCHYLWTVGFAPTIYLLAAKKLAELLHWVACYGKPFCTTYLICTEQGCVMVCKLQGQSKYVTCIHTHYLKPQQRAWAHQKWEPIVPIVSWCNVQQPGRPYCQAPKAEVPSALNLKAMPFTPICIDSDISLHFYLKPAALLSTSLQSESHHTVQACIDYTRLILWWTMIHQQTGPCLGHYWDVSDSQLVIRGLWKGKRRFSHNSCATQTRIQWWPQTRLGCHAPLGVSLAHRNNTTEQPTLETSEALWPHGHSHCHW